MEWIRAQQNLAVFGPPGTGQSHLRIGCGHAAVQAGFQARYFSAAALLQVLYRGLAATPVAQFIVTPLPAAVV
ncbi:ATP-binding protein, partial [Mycobacterium avium]|uniref:ATP-binding protein n=1 Tax=Mycobacterium avium TaxID=1764 RepID=UPI002F269154